MILSQKLRFAGSATVGLVTFIQGWPWLIGSLITLAFLLFSIAGEKAALEEIVEARRKAGR